MTAASSPDWDDFRRQMPVARRWAYFDHAAVCPLSEPASAAMAALTTDMTENGDANWLHWAQQVENVRRAAAKLINAEPAEIALVRNTTEGINLVAEGFPWQPGDNVVTLADEFPSNQYAWLNLASRGVQTRRVPVTDGRVEIERLAAACDARTRIISVSWVGYASGWRNDLDALAELAHQRGAYLFVDAIQGLGVFPLDVRRTPVDFLAADGHKWLLGPEGAGIFYLRREHLERLRPLGLGWNSVRSSDFNHIELVLKDSAARYEGGTNNMAGFVALGASLELLASWPPGSIAQRVLAITDLAVERLRQIGATIASSRDGDRRSGIVSFDQPGSDPPTLRKQCLAAGIALSCRAGRLRISPHAYNNAADVEKLVEVLQDKC
jgi:cysteine desulfurase / selenocysteine lyase